MRTTRKSWQREREPGFKHLVTKIAKFGKNQTRTLMSSFWRGHAHKRTLYANNTQIGAEHPDLQEKN